MSGNPVLSKEDNLKKRSININFFYLDFAIHNISQNLSRVLFKVVKAFGYSTSLNKSLHCVSICF